VAVLRLSGAQLSSFAQRLCGLAPQARHAHLVKFRDLNGEVLDQGLLLWFPAPHSYTGEDVLELHTHGGDVAPRRVMRACLALGARPAEPGEFTRRAFEHGKLDLAQAEAVGDLIEAGGEAAARGALRSLSGEFSLRMRALQDALTAIRIQVEGALDFPEEVLPAAEAQRMQSAVASLARSLSMTLAEARRSAVLRSGRQVVLLGAPNVGKSSLLNRLAAEDLAIVSPEAGTTRDTVRTHLELGGLRLEFVDTAGVRTSAQALERLGIERTWAAVARADLVICLRSFGEPAQAVPGPLPEGAAVIEVWNKSDLVEPVERDRILSAEWQSGDARVSRCVISVSALTGEGIAELQTEILTSLGWSAGAEPAFLARDRHVAALESALVHLQRAARGNPASAARSSAGDPGDPGDPGDDGRGGTAGAMGWSDEDAYLGEELLAEELRLAQKALDSVLGQFAADDLLGEIFAHFCIGK
jgi:tRNA modification GTPase